MIFVMVVYFCMHWLTLKLHRLRGGRGILGRLPFLRADGLDRPVRKELHQVDQKQFPVRRTDSFYLPIG